MKKEHRKNKIIYFLRIANGSLYGMWSLSRPQRFSPDESGLNTWKEELLKYLNISDEQSMVDILSGQMDPSVISRSADWSIVSTFFPQGEEVRKLWKKRSDNSIASFSRWLEERGIRDSKSIIEKLSEENKSLIETRISPTPPPISEPTKPASGEQKSEAPKESGQEKKVEVANKSGKNLGDDKKELIEEVESAVKAVSGSYGIPEGVIFGQWALESSYGRKDIGGYNYFGIKGSGPAGSTSARTNEEYQSGRVSRETAKFKKFNNPKECFEEYGGMLSSKDRYKYATQAFRNDPAKFIIWIWGRGYATDSQYPISIARTAKSIGLTIGRNDIGWDYTPEELDLIQRMAKLDAGKERYDLVTRELGPKT